MITMMKLRSGAPDYLGLVLVLVYIYAFVAMYVMRMHILPSITPHIDGGNLGGDPQYYHHLALALAEKIQTVGIEAWELRPNGQGPAGIVALIYAFTTNQLAVIALNATLHSISSVFLILLLRQWFSPVTAFLSALPFVLSLYQMHWFSQINKDSYVACGAMLFVYGIVQGLKFLMGDHRAIILIKFFLPVFVGAAIISVARPLVVLILQYLSISAIAAGFLRGLFSCQVNCKRIRSLFILFICMGFLLCLHPFTHGAASDKTISEFSSYAEFGFKLGSNPNLIDYPIADKCFIETTNKWNKTNYFPDSIDIKLKAILTQRCLYFMQAYDANPATRQSVLDIDIHPLNAIEVIKYYPRAISIGLFTPFPSSWFYSAAGRGSVFYSMVSVETIVFYLSFAALIFWILLGNSKPLYWVPILLCAGVIGVYGLGVPYVGALYRYRYPFWMIIQCMGMAALIYTFESVTRKNITVEKVTH